MIPDKALVQVAEQCAEAILRCRFRRSPGSNVPTVPVGPRPSAAPRDRMVGYGFAAPPDPTWTTVAPGTGGSPADDGSTLTPAAPAPVGSPRDADSDDLSVESFVVDDDA